MWRSTIMAGPASAPIACCGAAIITVQCQCTNLCKQQQQKLEKKRTKKSQSLLPLSLIIIIVIKIIKRKKRNVIKKTKKIIDYKEKQYELMTVR